MLTPQGMKIDPEKVKAIQQMPAPTNKQELESFLGLGNYLKRHSYVLTTLTKHFQSITKKGALFSWESQHEEAFQKIKQVLVEVPILAYYDARANNVIQTDASNKGIGAVLLQIGKPVA